MAPFQSDAFDLYLPPSQPEPGHEPPLLAYIHGGAWRTGLPSASTEMAS